MLVLVVLVVLVVVVLIVVVLIVLVVLVVLFVLVLVVLSLIASVQHAFAFAETSSTAISSSMVCREPMRLAFVLRVDTFKASFLLLSSRVICIRLFWVAG